MCFTLIYLVFFNKHTLWICVYNSFKIAMASWATSSRVRLPSILQIKMKIEIKFDQKYLRTMPLPSNNWITGIEVSMWVLKRLTRDSGLSSTRPEVFPRSKHLSVITSSEHSKRRMKWSYTINNSFYINLHTWTLSPTSFSQPSRFSILRGNPSIIIFFWPWDS